MSLNMEPAVLPNMLDVAPNLPVRSFAKPDEVALWSIELVRWADTIGKNPALVCFVV